MSRSDARWTPSSFPKITHPGSQAVNVRVDGGDAAKHRVALALRLRLRLRRRHWLPLRLALLRGLRD